MMRTKFISFVSNSTINKYNSTLIANSSNILRRASTLVDSLPNSVDVCGEIRPQIVNKYVNPLRKADAFDVNNLVNLKEFFDARVHLGHKEDTLNDSMRQYIFGSRLGHLIFDLEKTTALMRDALNFTAHIAHRDGLILFISSFHQHCHIVEKTAQECGEYAHTRFFPEQLLTNSDNVFGTTIRHPDLIIFTSVLNDVLQLHVAVHSAAKLNIPTIGIVDSNSDPTIITYPVPGNDDSAVAIELYCKLFKNAILKGKKVRQQELEMQENNGGDASTISSNTRIN